MPDTRTQRGPHPKDAACFKPELLPTLESAVSDLSWLLSRGYSDRAAVKLVGDRYALRDRQRKALQRCAASDADCRNRRDREVAIEAARGERLAVDGYNVLLTVEAALSGGVLLLARDGTLRDLAAMSGHYRRVHATRTAVELLAAFFSNLDCVGVDWYLDRPVSNSGRLKRLIEQIVDDCRPSWQVELTDRTDDRLIHSPHIVASADSAVLDRCGRWLNLTRRVVEAEIPEAWIVDLRGRPT
jgi:hypothetical protein